jgi:hypothetical protein
MDAWRKLGKVNRKVVQKHRVAGPQPSFFLNIKIHYACFHSCDLNLMPNHDLICWTKIYVKKKYYL